MLARVRRGRALTTTPLRDAHLQIGYVASIATKLCDTFQSEIGKAYGKRCFLGESGINDTVPPAQTQAYVSITLPSCSLATLHPLLLLEVTNLKPVPRGTEGAVSVEGTAAGVVGAMVIAGYGCASGLTPWSSLAAILIASQVGKTNPRTSSAVNLPLPLLLKYQ